MGLFRGDPILFDVNIPSLLEPFNTGVTTRTLTVDPSPVTVCFHFPIAPVPVPVGMVAAPADSGPVHLVAHNMAEPQAPERPHISTENVGLTIKDIFHKDELPIFIPSDKSNSSTDTTSEKSVYPSKFPNAKISKSPQVRSSEAKLSKSYDRRQKLPARDYHNKIIQNETPTKVCCKAVFKPAAPSNWLTQNQKRHVILDSCRRTRTVESSFHVHTKSDVHKTYTAFRHRASQCRIGIQNIRKR